jgi:hypothetical protein
MPTSIEPQTLRAFPGLHFFEDRDFDRALFFGRETEIKQLTERIIAEDLTVLFGKSGDGKTSLINAGLKPRLRELGYLPVRARLFDLRADQTPLDVLYQTLAEEAQAHGLTLPQDWQRATLWETFFALQPTPENKLKPVVLILDQFEELFTLLAARPKEQEDFIAQLADLARGRLPESVRENYRSRLAALPGNSEAARKLEQILYGTAAANVRLVLSLREDYLAFLNNLGKRIPKVFASRYRLSSLAIAQARLAIANPPQQEVLGEQRFRIDDDAIAALLEFLAVQSSSSGVNEETIGPPQLQVLLSQLEKQMRDQRRERITVADLGGEKGMRQLLSRYYRGILAKFPRLRIGSGPRRLSGFGLVRRLQPLHSPRFAVRCLCEERLITSAGNRNSRHEEEIIREIGVVKDDLDKLVDSRLLRREPRLQESFYELSHDSLVPSLQAAGGVRKAWMTSLKFAAIAAVAFVVINWGVPFVQSFFAMDTLRAEFKEVQAGKMRAVYFRERLDNMRGFVRDTTQLAKLHEAFDDWRTAALHEAILSDHTNRKAADSLLLLLKIEYPLETELYTRLSISLTYRDWQKIVRRVKALLESAASDTTALTKAHASLDSVQSQSAGNPEFIELRAKLEERKGNLREQRQLEEKARIIREAASFTLQEAIKLREPRNGIVKGDTLGKASAVEIVLENSPALQGASLFLNDKPMKLQARAGEKQRYYTGLTQAPPRGAQMEVAIKAIDKGGNEGRKTFAIKIDRARPRVLSFAFWYRENEEDEWHEMKSNQWRGKFLRVKVLTSEPVETAQLDVHYVGTHTYSSYGPDLDSQGQFISFIALEVPSEATDVEAEVLLEDLAGWNTTCELWRGQIARVQTTQQNPAQQILNAPVILKLRSTPDSALTAEAAKALIKKNDFYCSAGFLWSNPKGGSVKNDFVLENKGDVVFDRATGLRWQRSGSAESMTFARAQEYVAEMNRKKFAGHNDWCLPSLEKAMSLIEPHKTSRGLYLDPNFDIRQLEIWTSDFYNPNRVWSVTFEYGYCRPDSIQHLRNSVRLVR